MFSQGFLDKLYLRAILRAALQFNKGLILQALRTGYVVYLCTTNPTDTPPMFSIRFRAQVPNPLSDKELDTARRKTAVESTDNVLSNMEKFFFQDIVIHN